MPDDLIETIRYYVTALWERRWGIVAITWCVSLPAWVAVALLPSSYAATAKIYVDTESIIGPLMKNLAVMPDVARQIQTVRDTLLSRPNLTEVMARTGLDRGVSGPLAYEDLLRQLGQQIQVQPLNASLFEISYGSRDPELAYRVVSAVTNLFVERNLGHGTSDVEAARAFIGQQIGEYEAKLRQADLAIARFKREHAGELGGTSQAQRELDDARTAKRTLENERASASWQRDQLALQLVQVPRRLRQSDAKPGPTPAEARLAQLQTELDQALLAYTERHPAVLGLRRLVAQAAAEVAAERAGGGRDEPTVANPVYAQLQEQLRGADLRITDLDRRLKLVAGDIDRLSLKVDESPQVEADLLRLTRGYETLSKNYQELVQRRETANLAKQMDAQQAGNVAFRVLEPPVVPRLPNQPQRPLLMLAASVLGLGAGFGFAGLRVLLNKQVVRLAQLAESFDLPILGAVGELAMPGARLLLLAEFAAVALLLAANIGCSGGLAYLYHANPAMAMNASVRSDGAAAWLRRPLHDLVAALPSPWPGTAASGEN